MDGDLEAHLADVRRAQLHVDDAGVRVRVVVHDGEVALVDLAVFEGLDQGGVGLRILGGEHKATGLAVEPVAQLDGHVLALVLAAEVLVHALDQRVGQVPPTGVHHQARGLVDDQHVVVLEDHLQRPRVRDIHVQAKLLGDHHHDDGLVQQLATGALLDHGLFLRGEQRRRSAGESRAVSRRSILGARGCDQHVAVLDQPLDRRARAPGQVMGQEVVQAHDHVLAA